MEEAENADVRSFKKAQKQDGGSLGPKEPNNRRHRLQNIETEQSSRTVEIKK